MSEEKKTKIETMRRWSPLQIPGIIKAHYRAMVPANFIAEPSTVKSEGVLSAAKQLAKELGREFVDWNRAPLSRKQELATNPGTVFIFADVRASETDIGELRLQDLKTDKNYITFKYNVLFEALSNPEAKGILFFDEMNLAPNMIKAQFYKIINDKAVGDIPISDGVLCVSAGNEAEHSRGVTEDPVPLVLRRGNYFLRPLNDEEYLDYATGEGDVHQYIVGYLGFAPGDVHKVEYDLPDGVGQACPRTWKRLSDILKANQGLGTDEILVFATGLVGPAAATKFVAFVKTARDVNIDSIIAKPADINKFDNDKDLSMMYALISGVVDRYKNDKKVLRPAVEMAIAVRRPEFGAFLLRSVKNSNPTQFLKQFGDEKIFDKQIVAELVNRYGKYLKAD